MNISKFGIEFIKKQEGLRTKAYRDAGGILTIGYGHVDPTITENLEIDEVRATELLTIDLVRFVHVVDTSIKVLRTQEQFDAMVSLAFNIGDNAFKNSTLVEVMNRGDVRRAADEFLRWNKVNGRPNDGLTKRRRMERGLFLS